MNAHNRISLSQVQIQKAWERTEYKQHRRFIALMVILVTLVMTSGFSGAFAPSAQGAALDSTSTLCLDDYLIAFGEVKVGKSAQSKLVLGNCGSTPLTLGDTTMGGPDSSEFFADNPAGVVLQGQEKCYITTTFAPMILRNGERTGQLTISSSSNQASVLLTGTAKIPDGFGTKAMPLTLPDGIPPCVPPKPYGLVCLVNQTDWTINYRFKWGDGEWEDTNVNANASRHHWWTYAPGSHASPNFQVSFDADFTGGTDYKLYDLKRYQASDTTCWAGKVYEFEKVGPNAIELYDSGN